ncbi:serine/threonine-protein kinase [Candidatus Uabimicrobium sp. HlEnr_7]|uniref:serine/threonine-protein kinase n=1 Tax=Candidatus Uabimicrobium helgolandensis TaxID=3095367 RepID=UPI003556612F
MSKIKLFLSFLYENNAITKSTLVNFSGSEKQYRNIEALAEELLDLGKVAEDDLDLALKEFYGKKDIKLPKQLYRKKQQRFYRYLLLEELGCSGMAKVYKAVDERLDRKIALKITKLTNDRKRFLTEVNTIAKLQHPNIITIYDVGEYQGFCYYTMKYISGKTLTQVLREGIDFDSGLEIFYKVVCALDYIHNKGVIHRDLKPDNIIIDKDGTPIIIDFGLVKNIDDTQKKTSIGIVVGTPCYMSPEQVLNIKIDARSDIFSLGVILYEMLTGVSPFFSENIPQTLFKLSFYDPPQPRTIYPHIAIDLETICMKCLEKHSHYRYAKASMLAEDIRKFQNSEVIEAKPVNALRRLYKFACNNKSMTAFTVILTIVVAFYVYLNQHFLQQQKQQIRKVNIKFAQMAKYKADLAYSGQLWREAAAYSGISLQLIKNYQGQDVNFLRNYNKDTVRLCLQRDSLLWQKQFSQPIHLSGGHVTYLKDGIHIHDLSQDKVIAHLQETDLKSSRAILMNNGKSLITYNSPDKRKIWNVNKLSDTPKTIPFKRGGRVSYNERFAYVVDKGRYFIYDLLENRIHFDLSQSDSKVHFSENGVFFSPDNKLFIYFVKEGHGIVVRDLQTTKHLYTLEDHDNIVTDILFTDDNNTLISSSFDGRLCFWDLSSGKRTIQISSDIGQIKKIALSHNEQVLAVWYTNGYILLRDVNYYYRPFNTIHVRENTNFAGMGFSEDDTFLYTQSSADTIVCWRVFYKKQLFKFSAYESHRFVRLTINYNEQVLATTILGQENVVKLWRLSEQKLLTELSHPQPVIQFDFHPEKNILLCATSKNIYIWDVSSQKLRKKLSYHTGNVTHAQFALTRNSLLASGDSQGNVIFYNLVTQKIHKKFPSDGGKISCLHFSLDGEKIAIVGKDIRLWDLKSDQLIQQISGKEFPHDITSLQFIDNKRLIVYTIKGMVCVWSIKNKKVQQVFPAYHNFLYYKHFIKEYDGILGGHDLIDFASGRPSQLFMTAWTTVHSSILLSDRKVIISSNRGNICGYQLPVNFRYHATKLPKWVEQFSKAKQGTPHSSPFDFRQEVPGWFIEKALEEYPQKITEVLFDMKITDDLQIKK